MSEHNAEVMDFLSGQAAKQGLILDDLRRGQREVITRIGQLESAMAGLRRDSADSYGQMVGLSQRLDGMDGRLERMERRLGFFEPAL